MATAVGIPVAAHGKPKCGNCARPLPWIVNALDDDFADVAEQADVPVLVDMWATWCGPCRMVCPVLDQLAHERAGDIKLVRVDVDRAPLLAERFNVRSIPTLMILRDGEVVARQPDAVPAPPLRAWLDEALVPEVRT